jgi:hypothetical protein
MVSDWRDFLIWWLVSLIAAATIVGGKIGLLLWRLAPDPPSDPELAAHWRRRRRWLAYAELSALPAFATVSIAVTIQREAEPIMSVLIAMALGAIGFTLLLDGIQWLFRQRIGLTDGLGEEKEGAGHG